MLPFLIDNPYFSYLKKIVKTVFYISFILFLFISFYKPPLPDESGILSDIKSKEPVQSELPVNQKDKVIVTNLGKYEYRLTPLYNYELEGLIVTDYNSDNWLDVRHQDDPGNIKDICVIWGENILNGSYRQVKFSSGEFTCYYRWEKSLETPFYPQYLSNNHLIPQNERVAEEIKKSKIGDQVRVKGFLANYEVRVNGREIFKRNTSTVRDDSRNGACEIIYVTEFEILKENALNFKNFQKPIGYTSLLSAILGFVFFLLG